MCTLLLSVCTPLWICVYTCLCTRLDYCTPLLLLFMLLCTLVCVHLLLCRPEVTLCEHRRIKCCLRTCAVHVVRRCLSSSLLTLCTCTLLVYRICMSVCLFVSPWTSRLATSLECIMPTSVWMNRDCDCECSIVYVCLLYTLALCTLTICVLCYRYLFCRVVPLFIWIIYVTRIVWYSSTRDLLGLAVTPGWCAWQPWMLLTRSRSLVIRLFGNDSWLMSSSHDHCRSMEMFLTCKTVYLSTCIVV